MVTKTTRYKVVINHEEQYNIIPLDQTLNRGWREVGKEGNPKDCLTFIEEVWTDMKLKDRERLLRTLKR